MSATFGYRLLNGTMLFLGMTVFAGDARGREKFYFEKRDRLLEIEGDLILPLKKSTPRPGKAELMRSHTWPGDVPIVFDANADSSFRNRFLAAAGVWDAAGGPRFVDRNAQADYIFVGIDPSLSNVSATGVASYGRVGGEQYILFVNGQISETTILHEIGHALGFLHEHQRTDRDRFLRVEWQNVLPARVGDLKRFHYYSQETSYDFESIMHYRFNFGSRNGDATLIPHPGYEDFSGTMGGFVLSPIDKLDVASLYAVRPEGVPVSIPDPKLRELLLRGYDFNGDGQVDTREAESAYVMDLEENGIADLTGLEAFKNLTALNLDQNQIADLSPLAGLTRLYTLVIWDNRITDLSPLAGLTELEWLWARYNLIDDLAPLANLKNLRILDLTDNRIEDLSPLADLDQLEWLTLSNNRIEDLGPLQHLPSLRRLHLSHNFIEDLTALVASPGFGFAAGAPDSLIDTPGDLLLFGNFLGEDQCDNLNILGSRSFQDLQFREQLQLELPCPEPHRVDVPRWVPHVTARFGNFRTSITMVNHGEEAGTLHLQPYTELGRTQPAAQYYLQAGESLTLDASEVFPATGVSHFSIEGCPSCTVNLGYRALDGPAATAHLAETMDIGTDFFLNPGDWDVVFDGMALVNLGDQPAELFAEQYTEAGERVAVFRAAQFLPPNGKALLVFDEAFSSDAYRIAIHATQPAVMTLLRGSRAGQEPKYLFQTGVQGLPPRQDSPTRWISHITSPHGDFQTRVTVTNTKNIPGTVTLNPFDRYGVPLSQETVALGPGESRSWLAPELFSEGTASHFAVEGDHYLAVNAAYRVASHLNGSWAAVMETSVTGRRFTATQGERDLVWDGAAIVNLGDSPARVEGIVLDDTGAEVFRGAIEAELAPGAKALLVFQDFFPDQTSGRVVIGADKPMSVLLLRGTHTDEPRFLFQTLPTLVQP